MSAENALYLILHKVRGEATYDVAQQIQLGNELGWIIPTSGHRAYPFFWWALSALSSDEGDRPARQSHILPVDHPDHYQAGRVRVEGTPEDLITLFGRKPYDL